MLHEQMRTLGFDVHESEIFNASYACLIYLRSQPRARCYFLVDDFVKAFFNEIPTDSEFSRFCCRWRLWRQVRFSLFKSCLSVFYGWRRTHCVTKVTLLGLAGRYYAWIAAHL